MKVPESWKNCEIIFKSSRMLIFCKDTDIVEFEYYLTLWRHKRTKKIYCNLIFAPVNDPNPKFYSSNMFSIKLIKKLYETYLKNKKVASK